MINPFKRAVRIGETAGAALYTGTDKIRSGFGNGDCLLLDGASRVFAVADAAERFPEASRKLLRRLSSLVAETKGWLDARRLGDIVRQIWAKQKFLEKSTLSCVALASAEKSCLVHIAHGGDSRVILVDTQSGKRYFQTSVDMNFAGRGLTPPIIESHPLRKKTDRIILASDGLNDFSRHMAGAGGVVLPDVFFQRSIDALMAGTDAIYWHRENGWEFDDMGLIVIDPFKPWTKGGPPIIVGGTSPAQEKAYARDIASGESVPEWIEDEAWRGDIDQFDRVGISVGNPSQK